MTDVGFGYGESQGCGHDYGEVRDGSGSASGYGSFYLNHYCGGHSDGAGNGHGDGWGIGYARLPYNLGDDNEDDDYTLEAEPW